MDMDFAEPTEVVRVSAAGLELYAISVQALLEGAVA